MKRIMFISLLLSGIALLGGVGSSSCARKLTDMELNVCTRQIDSLNLQIQQYSIQIQLYSAQFEFLTQRLDSLQSQLQAFTTLKRKRYKGEYEVNTNKDIVLMNEDAELDYFNTYIENEKDIVF